MSLYRAFGLTIESAIELPEMLPLVKGAPDVNVAFERVDSREFDNLKTVNPNFKWWQAVPSKDRLLFGCAAGVYEITNGSRIAIDLEPDAPPETVRMFLLGSALGALQIQRGRVPIHGGAVVSRGRAVIITGAQGAGKSTMTSAMVCNGFKYLTDDVSSFEIGETGNVVHAAYPQRKLVRDACISLGFSPEELPVIDANRDKFAIRDRENWQGEAVPAGMIIELIPAESGENLRTEPLTGHACLRLIMRSLYRNQMHMHDGKLPPQEFKKILIAAGSFEAHRVYIPRGIENMLQVAGSIAEVLHMTP